MGQISSLYILKDEELLFAFNEAKRLEFGQEFLELLAEEITKRNLSLENIVTQQPAS